MQELTWMAETDHLDPYTVSLVAAGFQWGFNGPQLLGHGVFRVH